MANAVAIWGAFPKGWDFLRSVSIRWGTLGSSGPLDSVSQSFLQYIYWLWPRLSFLMKKWQDTPNFTFNKRSIPPSFPTKRSYRYCFDWIILGCISSEDVVMWPVKVRHCSGKRTEIRMCVWVGPARWILSLGSGTLLLRLCGKDRRGTGDHYILSVPAGNQCQRVESQSSLCLTNFFYHYFSSCHRSPSS